MFSTKQWTGGLLEKYQEIPPVADNKNYTVKMRVANGPGYSNVMIWLTEEGEQPGGPVMYGQTTSAINIEAVTVGSSNNNKHNASTVTNGQWNGVLRFFRIIPEVN